MPFICIKIQKDLEKQREIYWTLCNHLMWKRTQMNKHLCMYNWIKFLYTWNKQHQKSTIFQYKITRKVQNLKTRKVWHGEGRHLVAIFCDKTRERCAAGHVLLTGSRGLTWKTPASETFYELSSKNNSKQGSHSTSQLQEVSLIHTLFKKSHMKDVNITKY